MPQLVPFFFLNLVTFANVLLTVIIFFNFTLFYLDHFKLSQNKFIRYLQILTPIWIILGIITLFYLNTYTFDNNGVLFLNGDKNTSNTVNIGGNLEVNKDAAEALARNVGFAGTTAGIAGAVGKAISKSSLPPVQKAGIVIASGIAGAGVHLIGSNINKVISSNTTNGSSSTSTSSTKTDLVSKLMDDSGSSPQNSELMNVILGIDMITYACLSLIIILFIIVLFKFYLNEDKIKLNFSSLIGDKLNNSLNYYLIKIIQLNKKTSNVYIFIIFIVLFISLGFEGYYITKLYNNLDKFVDLHINR